MLPLPATLCHRRRQTSTTGSSIQGEFVPVDTGNVWRHFGCHRWCWGYLESKARDATTQATKQRTAPQQRLSHLSRPCAQAEHFRPPVQSPAMEWLLPSFPEIYFTSKGRSVLTCFTGGTQRTGDGGTVLSSHSFSNRGGINEHKHISGALAKGVVAGFLPSSLGYPFIHSHCNCLPSVAYLALCSHLSPG